MSISLRGFENEACEVWYGEIQIGGLRIKDKDTYDIYLIGNADPTEVKGTLHKTVTNTLHLYLYGKLTKDL